MDAEVPVLTGFLNVPTQSGFSLNRISKKKPGQRRYCLLFKSSRHGIERLEICETKDDKNRKIITLENCVKITQEPAPANLIQIVKMTGTLTLNALSEDDLKEWLVALQTVAFRDKGGTLCRNSAIEEDNDLYCSSYGDGLFIITLIPSETSRRCNIEGKTYMLHLTATELQLKSAEDLSIIIAKWPYRFIRKYGYRDGKFTFEAGRKCNTGEGVFILDHTNPQEVFRCMSSKMKSMKKLISGESLNNLDCGENQLSAAMSMEAGSRSPLPPSPSNQNPSEFETNSTQSSISTRGFLSSNDSLNSVSVNSNTPFKQLTKSIPNKPPRKLPTQNEKSNSSTSIETKSPQQIQQLQKQQSVCDQFKKFQNYEPVSITTTTDPNKTGGSTVILKSPSPDLSKQISDVCHTHNNNNNNNNNINNSNNNQPPDLPVRNESTAKPPERDYEVIENITEAWRTRGINDIKHTERITTPEDELIDYVLQRSQSARELINGKPRPTELSIKMINIDDSSIEESYDRLDFLSPNNKTPSSGYKTILTVSSANNPKKAGTTIPNDYELIASPDMHPCRLADDSYLGYGVLRKPSMPGPQVPTNANKNISNVSQTMINEVESTQPLDHRSFNGLSYAIVSKPKRV